MKNFDQRELPLLFDALKPFISPMVEASLAQSSNIQSASLESISTHAIDGPYHTGTLNPAQAPDFFLLNGTRTITGQVIIATSSAMPPFSLSAANQNQLVVGLRADSVNKQVIAGFGMTGGGTLTSNVTITLGNPTSLSSTSTNAVTSTSHSHVIDSSIARSAITISVSGLGLSGGGNLSANRTITLTSSSAPAGASILASDSSGNLTVQNLTTVSTITAGSDSDVTTILGRAKVFSGFTDTAMFAHFDFATTTSYALRQTNVGQTLVNAASGQTVYIRINNSDIVTFDATNIIFSTSKVLKSSGYTSGWAGSGFEIDQNVTISGESFAEFDNLSVRGTMSVYELVINQIRATNGTMIASSAAKIASIAGSVWTLEDPEGSLVTQFAANDLVIIQNVDVNASTVVKRIVRRVSAVSSNTITVTAATGGPADTGSPAKGDVVVRFGNSSNTARQGVVLITSDFANSPYIDVISGVTSWADWTGGTKTKVRIGLLTGITSTSNEYGFIAGNGFTATDSWVKVSTSAVQQNNVSSAWKTSGVDFITIDPTNGIVITVNTAYVSQRAFTFSDGTETGGMYSYSQTLGKGIALKTISAAKGSIIEILSEANATYQAQTLVKAKSGSNTSTIDLTVTTGGSRTITIYSDTTTFYPLGGTGTSIFDSNGFRIFTNTALPTSTLGGSENVRIGVKNISTVNYPTVIFEIPSGTNTSIYGSPGLLNFAVGANSILTISSTGLSTVYKITALGTIHSGSGANLTTSNISHFTGSYNSNASISMSTGAWGYSSVILFQAYHVTQPTGGFLASGASKYFGSQYTGNVTAPGMIQWDANGNLWRFAIGETGLVTGDDITTWDVILTISRTSLSVLPDTDNFMSFGRVKIGYAGFSDNAAFAHYDHMSSTNYALIQGSGGTTVLNGASGGVINFRIANVATASLGTVGLKIGDNSAAAYPIDAFEDSSGSFSDIIMSLERRISTTPANGMGGSIRFGIESSTTNNRDAGRIGMRWDTVTDASRAASGFLSAYYITTENVVIEWGSNSTGGMLGFYGATKQNKQTVTGSRAGNAALASVLTALANLGLITNSSTA